MNPKKQTLLWRLEGTQWPGPSYLFGTMHVRDRRAFHLLEPVLERIAASDAFATEFDLEDIAGQFDPAMLSLPPGQTLDRLLSPRHYDRLRRMLLKSVGLDIHPLRDKLPVLIANLVDERILSRDMPLALDEALWNFARRQGKICLGIETYREQLLVLRRIPLDQQLRSLLALGRNLSRHRQHLRHLTRLYEEGRIQQLYRSARRGAQGMRHLMLYERNRIMAERIVLLITEHPTFCAVGAAHLAGEKGVIRLLKRKGVKVRPE